jgi:hypothetical protein
MDGSDPMLGLVHGLLRGEGHELKVAFDTLAIGARQRWQKAVASHVLSI